MTQKPYAEYNGVKIYQLAVIKQAVEATIGYGKTRIVFKGQIGIDRTEGSYRYGDEVLVALWMVGEPKVETRCPQKGYSRIQISMPIPDAIKLFKEALDKIEEHQAEVMKKKPLGDF